MTGQTDNIQERIYRIRGKQVMLDSDLAELYGVKTKVLNQAVRRNIERFPPDFMFQPNVVELEILRSQIVTSKQIPLLRGTTETRGGRRYTPFAITEHGVAMLATVLRSSRAIQINIAIIRVFIKLRHAVLSSRDVARRVERLEGKIEVHETDIRLIRKDIRKLKEETVPPRGPSGPLTII